MTPPLYILLRTYTLFFVHLHRLILVWDKGSFRAPHTIMTTPSITHAKKSPMISWPQTMVMHRNSLRTTRVLGSHRGPDIVAFSTIWLCNAKFIPFESIQYVDFTIEIFCTKRLEGNKSKTSCLYYSHAMPKLV